MSRLTWIERDHGWRAGPYEIELAAPQLWVCTRRLHNGRAKVEMTSGSLSALKTGVEKRDHRRRNLHRALLYLAGFILAMAFMFTAAVSGWASAPLLVVVFSSIGLFAVLRSLDLVTRRPWESIRHHYQ